MEDLAVLGTFGNVGLQSFHGLYKRLEDSQKCRTTYHAPSQTLLDKPLMGAQCQLKAP